MLKKERQAHIIQQLNIHNKVLSGDLSKQLDVSEDTIRRDLQELAETGELIKVHGGALSKFFHVSLKNGQVYSPDEKKLIAQKAVALITEGMIVLISGGTTVRELIKALPPTLNATFITSSMPTAMQLMEHPASEVIFIGNKLHKNAQMAVGAEVAQKLAGIRADLCILGTNSIDAEAGITDLEWELIEVKKAMVHAANQVVSLAISEKLNSVQHLQVCPIHSVDYLITELEPDNPLLKSYLAKGVNVL
jgi:DeoR/GlpR family transcriptional regulator of sugar metabolism